MFGGFCRLRYSSFAIGSRCTLVTNSGRDPDRLTSAGTRIWRTNPLAHGSPASRPNFRRLTGYLSARPEPHCRQRAPAISAGHGAKTDLPMGDPTCRLEGGVGGTRQPERAGLTESASTTPTALRVYVDCGGIARICGTGGALGQR